MDPRVREHAEVLVEHSTDIRPDDDVVVKVPTVAEDLAVALAEKIGEVGANPVLRLTSSRAFRSYYRTVDPEDVETRDHRLAEVEEADVFIGVQASRNVFATSDVPSEAMNAFRQAQRPVSEERMDTRWVSTQYPAPGEAQKAEMSTPEYEEFVYDAINKDWEAQDEFQQQLVEILDSADEVRIVSGDTTDVTLSLDGREAFSDNAEHNLPGGEVYTAPVPDSVEGEVLFDMPVVKFGREIENASLRFEGGEVVEHSADKNENALTELLETDEGARKVGELGIGMNRDIDQFTYNLLFDEKMGDTVHLAIGNAYDHTVPEDAEDNDSAIHVDMIVDMADDSFIEVDGEVVQRNGTFRFEDGFEQA